MNIKKAIITSILFFGLAIGLYAQYIYEAAHIGNFENQQDFEDLISKIIPFMEEEKQASLRFVSEKTRNEERIVQNAQNELPEIPTKGSGWVVVVGNSFIVSTVDYNIFFYANHDGRIYHWIYRVFQ